MALYPIDALIANRYEVVKVLTGGMGVVYLCLDRQEDFPVALKTWKPEYLPNRAARDRFLREGTIWQELGRHPHVVRCYRVFSPAVGPEVYLVLDWVAEAEGKRDASLRAWELNVEADYGFGEYEDSWGVEFYSDATTPTGA